MGNKLIKDLEYAFRTENKQDDKFLERLGFESKASVPKKLRFFNFDDFSLEIEGQGAFIHGIKFAQITKRQELMLG